VSKKDYKSRVGSVVGRYSVQDYFIKNNKSYYAVVCSEEHFREVRCDSLHKYSDRCYTCDEGHGKVGSKEHNSWRGMIQRCTNPEDINYHKYGAVGISVEEYFSQSFSSFYEYMGDCPEGMSLDRISPEGNYERGNVRWATPSTQGYNQKKRNTNTSGKTGVSYNSSRGKFSAYIGLQNKLINLGAFESFDDAVKAREEAELKYYGYIKE